MTYYNELHVSISLLQAAWHHSSYGIITSTKVSDIISIRILVLLSPLTLLGAMM